MHFSSSLLVQRHPERKISIPGEIDQRVTSTLKNGRFKIALCTNFALVCTSVLIVMMMIMIILIIYLTANVLSPGGSGYNART